MTRDPFYNQIIARLDGVLDPSLFEECAQDLLTRRYPSLVPIRGGSDLGMDGALANGEAEAYPFVCTTREDVIENLRGSLESYVANGGTRRKVILATSRSLSARRRRNLETAAKRNGFTLVQIHERASIANLLYRSPGWCHDLLNLTVQLPALSVFPVTDRPLESEGPLIGRNDDLEWLENSSGDRALVGQPGSGKTFLLLQLVKSRGWLFVVTEDLQAIVEGIRELEPPVIVVDDAHVRTNLLAALRHVRSQTRSQFGIVATCWPGGRDGVQQSLALSSREIRDLAQLRRPDVIRIITGAFERAPWSPTNALVSELADQAIGRPGLAATLAHFCLRGDISDVVRGDALAKDLSRALLKLGGTKGTNVLATFAIGGEFGMAMSDVAEFLEMGVGEVRGVVTELSFAGVLQELSATLSVIPSAFREVLVRDNFFGGASSLHMARVIDKVPMKSATLETLIGASRRGGCVPRELLESMLERYGTDREWMRYTALGEQEAKWVLKFCPARVVRVGRAALARAPCEAIPLLLERAVGDDREPRSYPEHPLRLVLDWILSGRPGRQAAIVRRKTLLDALREWSFAGDRAAVGVAAAAKVISPSYEEVVPTPDDSGVNLTWGLLNSSELKELEGLWPGVIDLLKACRPTTWEALQDAVWEWVSPRAQHVPDELHRQMVSFATAMMKDIAAIASDRPGILLWLKRRARTLGLEIGTEVPKHFELIYPEFDANRMRNVQDEEFERNARVVAEALASFGPQGAAERLAFYEQESNSASLHWPRLTVRVCTLLAGLVPAGDFRRALHQRNLHLI